MPRAVPEWRVVCTVPNNTSEWVQPVAQDALYHTRDFGPRMSPWHNRVCNLWPWAHSRGRIGYVSRPDPAMRPDTNWTQWFDL
jgi:hypothetical protein